MRPCVVALFCSFRRSVAKVADDFSCHDDSHLLADSLNCSFVEFPMNNLGLNALYFILIYSQKFIELMVL